MGTPTSHSSDPQPRLLAPHWTADFEETGKLVDKLMQNGQVILLDGGEELHDGLLHHLNKDNVPLYSISTSEGFLKFKEDFRRATVLQTRLTRMVYEGEVTRYDEEHTVSSSIVRRLIRFFKNSINIELRTPEETKMLNLGQFYIDGLPEERIIQGDIIEIDIKSGSITKNGRINDLEEGRGIQLEGLVCKNKVKIQNITLNDLDVAIRMHSTGEGIYSLLREQLSPVDVDKFMETLIHKRLATLNVGLIHIDEANNLDDQCFSLIDNALKSSLCPSIYLSAAQRMCERSGANIVAGISIPTPLLPRLVVIQPRDDIGMATFYLSCVDKRKVPNPIFDRVRENPSQYAILLAGPLESGKVGLAFEIAKELGNEVIFCQMLGSTECSSTSRKTLEENVRRAVSLRLKQTNKEVYQGEVTELSLKEIESTTSIIIGLKTNTNRIQLIVKRPLSDALSKEKVVVGDVVHIDAQMGAVTRVGRSDAFSSETDREGKVYVPLPKGEVHKKEMVQDIRLHDLDEAIAGERGHGICALVRRKLLQGHISENIIQHQEIDQAVKDLRDQGELELHPGVLFIDEVDILDKDCFTKTLKDLQSPLSPLIILATDKDISQLSPNGKLAIELRPMTILHTETCAPAKIVEVQESKPKIRYSVSALEKEVKFIEYLIAINTFFGAGAITSFMLGITNLETPPPAMVLLICILVFGGSSLFQYTTVLFAIQDLIKKAKEAKNGSKDTNEVWVKKSKVRRMRCQVVTGFITGSIAIACVILILVAYFLVKFNRKNHYAEYVTVIFVSILMLLSYLIFVSSIWKKLPMYCCLKKQKNL